MEEQQIVDENSHKKYRKRKKQLYNLILQQMEFYFSDSNLSKDRFLAQLIQADPYVDLSVFLRFNKIRTLTTNILDICKALQNSEILKLSDDNLRVSRITPIREKNNQDECTIYVERLPTDTEHEWLKQVFSKFGTVEYVSIPKYKHNKMIKGFAFIEFDTPETAKKALEYFESIGCKLPTKMPPDQLISITTFQAENELNSLKNIEKLTSDSSNELKDETQKVSSNENEDTVSEIESKVKKSKKRRKDEEQVGEKNEASAKIDDENIPIESDIKHKKNKKKKTENEGDCNEDSAKIEDELNGSDVKNKKNKKGKTENEEQDGKNKESALIEVEDTPKETDVKVKKNKKSKTINEEQIETDKECSKVDEKCEKVKKRKNTEEESEDNSEESSKQSKKRKVVNEPEENKDVTSEKEEKTAEINEEEECEDMEENDGKKKRKRKKSHKKNANDLKQIGLQVLSKREWKQLRNKYLNLQRQKMQNLKEHLHRSRFANNYHTENINSERTGPKAQKIEESAPRFKYTPGTIINFQLPEICTDIKKFKTDVKSHNGVEFVDISVGNETGYIRFADNENCKKFLDSFKASMKILEGEEEQQYWDKITKDREFKLKKDTGKKQRGREKLLRKAEKELGKHIRFENAE